MSIAELLIEEIKTLPENCTAEVLDFVGYLKAKEAKKQNEAENAKDQDSDTSWFEKGEGCPICAKHRDPVTGEPLYNAETVAGMQEVEDMISGKIPVKWHTSLDDLDKILGL